MDLEGTLLVGVDGGGTRTRAALLLGSSELGRAEAGAANPNVVGVEACAAAVATAIEAALRSAGRSAAEVACAGVGIAGAGAGAERRREVLGAIGARLPGMRLALFTDVEAALGGAFLGERGVIVVGGTGSVAMGFDGVNALAQAGGYGRRLGDAGSGYDVLARAARRVLETIDGMHAAGTDLTKALPGALGLGSARELIAVFARDLTPHELVAGVAAVADVAARGDGVAGELLAEAGRDLARLVRAVASRLPGPPLPVATTGGLLVSAAAVRVSLALALATGVPPLAIAPARAPAEHGAAWLAAAQHLGVPATLLPLLRALEAR
jgi:N-acetylglucosamine kinase-like BadF-type ATPase